MRYRDKTQGNSVQELWEGDFSRVSVQTESARSEVELQLTVRI